MNINQIINAVDETYYVVKVAFGEGSVKQYTYKVPKTVILEVDDTVIVSVGTGYKSAVVEELASADTLDYELDIEYKWIVAKLDLSAYTALLERDDELKQSLKEAQINNKRDQIKAMFGDGLKSLLLLANNKDGKA